MTDATAPPSVDSRTTRDDETSSGGGDPVPVKRALVCLVVFVALAALGAVAVPSSTPLPPAALSVPLPQPDEESIASSQPSVVTNVPGTPTVYYPRHAPRLRLSPGYNPAACGQAPNVTPIDPYKGCPIPGLNNLLYTQHNRWYCLYRDNAVMTLRDRTCNKGSHEKYRFSTMIQVRYDRLHAFHKWVAARESAGLPRPLFANTRTPDPHGGVTALLTHDAEASSPPAVRQAYHRFMSLLDGAAAHDVALGEKHEGGPRLCWADIMEKRLPAKCTWSDIPSFLGRPQWWEARHFIDFHPEYYTAVRRVLQSHIGDVPFVAVHLRRGDFQHHCTVIRRKKIPPLVQFWTCRSLSSTDAASCYPSLKDIEATIERISLQTGVRLVAIATNDPHELAPLLTPIEEVREKCLLGDASDEKRATHSRRRWCAFVLPRYTAESHPLQNARRLDDLVLDMLMLASASHFVFNRYSSFSATAFEVALIHGANTSHVWCW